MDMKLFEMKYDNKIIRFLFDETAPCCVCGNPVLDLSMGGPDICPHCDCGYDRTGKKYDITKDAVYLLKAYWYLKPYIPTFDRVSDVAVSLAAHGICVQEFDNACKRFLRNDTL
jgi:hypothetical protein